MSDRAACVAIAFLCATSTSAFAQRGDYGRMRGYFGDQNEFFTPRDWHGNVTYDGRFTFARIKYRGYGMGAGWAHDYPRAESHFMRIIREVTSIRPFVEAGPILGGNILALDDHELFKYPVAYLSEPGGWFPNDKEAEGLRNYLLKGGFIIFDDFDGGSMDRDWVQFAQQIQRVLPGARLTEIPQSHPIFDCFFKVDLRLLERGGSRGAPVYYGIWQDNDPRKTHHGGHQLQR